MNRRQFLYTLSSVAALSFIEACAPPPTKYYFNVYNAKNLKAPDIVHCITPIGHKPGTKPFILGGTCCCTPTEELVAMYHQDGMALDYDLDKLIAEYETRGIVLEHDNGWLCNNQCDSGPHVVHGGNCMVPPTLGTQNWENVITGKSIKTF